MLKTRRARRAPLSRTRSQSAAPQPTASAEAAAASTRPDPGERTAATRDLAERSLPHR